MTDTTTQRLVEQPLLVDGVKFDLGVFALYYVDATHRLRAAVYTRDVRCARSALAKTLCRTVALGECSVVLLRECSAFLPTHRHFICDRLGERIATDNLQVADGMDSVTGLLASLFRTFVY